MKRAVVAVLLGWMLVLGPWLPRASPLGAIALAAAGPTCDSTGIPTTTAYLPNVTKTLGGPAGWVTPFYIQNAGAIQTTVETSFFRFSDGVLVACRKTTGLPPGASLQDNPNADADLPDDTQFSVVAKSFGAPVVATVNQLQGSGASTESASYTGFNAGATKVYLPNVTRRFFGYDVPLIVQNLGTAPTTVAASFISFDGNLTFNTTLAVQPGRSGVIDPDFTAGLVDGTQYAVTLTSPQPIGVVVNAHNEAIGPVAYSHNGIAIGATTLYAPYVARVAGGVFSPVVVQNVGTAPTDATLAFTPLGGGAVQRFTLATIAAGASRAFDVRFPSGIAVASAAQCTVASATCLGSGEYSLQVTAASPVAAVVLPNSDTTAAGYLAATALAQRALLPVVMRTIGGPTGWTSNVYVQAGTATAATLRYYAITDGALVTTQQLTLAAGNGTVKLDPRTVTGLADNAQYAVTVDGGGGTLTAVVWEQATGGDSSMMYEGFPATALSATPAPGSITLAPVSATILASGTQQFTATVKDQFGAALVGQSVTWALTPTTLGTVGPTGFLTAGSGAGAGTLAAVAGPVSATATVTVSLPSTQQLGGFTFVVNSSGSSDIYVESSITAVDQQAIAAQAASDVLQVQTDFARSFTQRPRIYVFATTTGYTTGLSSVLGLSATEAASFGAKTLGIYASGLVAIGANWQLISSPKPISTIRHELTHMMEHQIVTTGAMPAWFDEGSARLEDLTVSGSQHRVLDNVYGAASMAATNTLLTLDDLTSVTTWNARTPPLSTYQYYGASQAVQFLQNDLGKTGWLRLYDLMAQGQTFAAAYQTVANQPFTTFSSAYAQRVKALAPTYPGIATALDSVAGAGFSFELYGFPPSATVNISVSGPVSAVPTSSGVNTIGTYKSYLGSAFPPGTYTVTVTWSGGAVTSSGAKIASLEMLSEEPPPTLFELSEEPPAWP